jgi:uncharacterized protein YqgC (DUF456 family)
VEILLYVLGALSLAAGVAGVVLPALPGSPLLAVGALLVAWAGAFQLVGWGAVISVAVIAIVIFAVDYVATLLGARAFGASRWALVGGAIGLVVGMFLGLPGLILGPAVGAVAFEYARNPDFERAARAGVGVLIGFVVGGAIKVALAFMAVGIVVFALVF